jgi:hypothetical protein
VASSAERWQGLTEVVEEKLDCRGGVAAEDLLDQVRIAAAERGKYVAVALDPARAPCGVPELVQST